MLGYSLDELSPISKDTFVSLSHPDDRELGESVLKQFLSGREARYETLRFRHRRDGWRYVHTRAVLAKRSSSDVSRWLVGTNEDVTGEHAAKHEVEPLAESMSGLIYSCLCDRMVRMRACARLA
ncbi:PAS domain-containing protein [Marinobacter salarius]|nr:PAS domain-containing protein [Marinobacter salarius]